MSGNVVKMLVLTGCRREEIAQLKWSEIVGDEVHLPASRTRNGEAKVIPLSAEAQALLASTPRIEGPFVFTTDGLKGISGWSRIKDKLDSVCGVKGWTIHDLRRNRGDRNSRNLASAFKSRKPSSAIPPARVAELWASTKGTTLQPRNKVLDKVIEIAIYAGLAAGLNDEAQITRLDIAKKTLSEKIAHNYQILHFK